MSEPNFRVATSLERKQYGMPSCKVFYWCHNMWVAMAKSSTWKIYAGMVVIPIEYEFTEEELSI